MGVCGILVFFIYTIIVFKVTCYEKTLRKIVRNQSKMVRRPFSDYEVDSKISWRNASLEPSDELIFSGHSQVKKKLHKVQRSKISSMVTPAESGNCVKPTYSKLKAASNGNMLSNELRLARNTFNNVTQEVQISTDGIFAGSKNVRQTYNKSNPDEIAEDTYSIIPHLSKTKYFPANEAPTKTVERTGSKEAIVIPNSMSKENSSLLVKGIFISNSELSKKPVTPSSSQGVDVNADSDDDKVDFLIQEKTIDASHAAYSYNVSTNRYSCIVLRKSKADIDAQENFSEFNIEPSWTSKKHYWNHIFDNRYETLMRNPNWPPLKVILVPRTHVDSIWKNTFERYHNDTVHKILSNVVKKLRFYNNLTFSWNEVSHLSQWWKNTSSKSRSTFRRLLKEGRLEITTGGWVESDEATSHIFGLVHQFIEGQQWLKTHLNYSPTVAWLTNTVTHSPTVTYLLSACGISNLVVTNLHYSWEEFFAEYQYSDFVWLQVWDNDKSAPSDLNTILGKIGRDRLPKHSVLTHFMQFNSDGFKACGPNQALCADFNFAKKSKKTEINAYNVKEKSEFLLEQYSKAGTVTPHNIIIAPIGGSYQFETQAEFDYQYNNYLKLAEFINLNRDIYKATIEFGTTKDYFNSILRQHKSYKTVKGDFVNYADLKNEKPAYWTGFFTSRPLFKVLLRRLQSTLRSTEIILSYATSFNVFQGFDAANIFELLIKARETVARLQDRHVVSGTLTANTMKYAYKQTLETVKNCWYIQEVAISLLSTKPDKSIYSPYVRKYVYRDGEFISLFKTVITGDQVYVFNSLCHERTEIIELIVRNHNIRIIDHNKKEVTIQINPVWKYSYDNVIRISRRFYKITFAIVVPPMTLELYRIKDTYDGTQNAATVYCTACIVDDVPGKESSLPFNIQPIETGDIQLESYKHRLIFDEHTGFLKHVVEKVSGIGKTVVVDYGAFKSSDVNSGVFLFNTNVSKPLRDILMAYRSGLRSKVMLIVSGQVTSELTSIFGRLLQSTTKIFNLLNSPLSNTIYIESKVDYEVSPKNREIELFMSLQTDISNGNSPEIFTDNNGFQYTRRILNINRRIESNMYPMTTMSFIQDHKSRLTVITDHAQGVTALQEGQMVVMLDRRVLFNDERGTNEGLADSSATCHRYYILLENFIQGPSLEIPHEDSVQLPSLSAVHLSKSLDFQLDIFIIDKNKTDLCYYAFLPLVKTSFPCDVALINYRVNFNKGATQNYIPGSALMILHRQSVSCNIDYDVQLHCNGDKKMMLEKIFHNVKAVYLTNLCGINKGVPVTYLNYVNFPVMELRTLRIYFWNVLS